MTDEVLKTAAMIYALTPPETPVYPWLSHAVANFWRHSAPPAASDAEITARCLVVEFFKSVEADWQARQSQAG